MTRNARKFIYCSISVSHMEHMGKNYFFNCRKKVKVKCTLVQALRLCTDLTPHRESRGIALLFHDHGTRRGMRSQRHAPASLYPRERPGTPFTGGWVGPRAGLDRCGKSHPHRDSIPRPSNPQPVAIPTLNCIVLRNLLHIRNVDIVGVLPVGL
jgi:hypothetical protein